MLFIYLLLVNIWDVIGTKKEKRNGLCNFNFTIFTMQSLDLNHSVEKTNRLFMFYNV